MEKPVPPNKMKRLLTASMEEAQREHPPHLKGGPQESDKEEDN
jgi:hypothetical protein